MGTKLHVLDFAVYRWRYSLGYIAVTVLFVALLIVAGIFIPDGVSSGEQQSAVNSSLLSTKHVTPDMVIDLPYHALQKVSLAVFGVHNLSIKAPSLLLALVAAAGMLLLLKRWFKRNTAILTALLAITTGPFLLIAQSGTPAILYILWPTWILLAGSELSNKSRFPLFWKIVLFTSVALSLYTPLSIYILIALLLATLFHPHLRHTILSLSKLKFVVGLLIGIILISPVVYAAFLDTHVLLVLAGIPGAIDLKANLVTLAGHYLNFLHPSNAVVMTPVYELATVLVALIGLYRVVTTKYTARSYIIIAWLLMLLILTIVSPDQIAVTFVPVLLLLGFGIDHLIRSWYRLFPRNPYARVAGLIPLVIFIASLTVSGIDRFVYGYLYDPATAHAFSKDLGLLSQQRRNDAGKPAVLIVSKAEEPFYKLIQRYNHNWHIATVTTSPTTPSGDTIRIATHDSRKPQATVERIITSSRQSDADRFYLYKNDAK